MQYTVILTPVNMTISDTYGDFLQNINCIYMLFTSQLKPMPQPERRAGDSRGKVLCSYFSIVPTVRVKYQGFVIYRQIWL